MMRVVLVVLAVASLVHSGDYARFRVWDSLTHGGLVYRAFEGQVVKPLVLPWGQMMWDALVTPRPGGGLYLAFFRLIAPAVLLVAAWWGGCLEGRRKDARPGS